MAGALLGGCHLYVYRQLRAAFPALAQRGRSLAASLVVLLAVLNPAAQGLLRTHYCELTCGLYWVSSLYLGLFFYVFLFALAGQLLLKLLGLLWLRRSSTPSARRATLLLGITVACAASGWGIHQARHGLRINKVRLSIAGLAPELDGLTIAHLSDLHVGSIVGATQLAQIVDRVNRLTPDLVVITGDLVDQDAERFAAVCSPLARLRARLGIFAVTGNHEYLSNAEAATRQASAAGIRFLRNEHVRLSAGLTLYGVDDPLARRLGQSVPTFEHVIGREARQGTSLLLHHQPIDFPRAADLGIDLMLAGHTHAGQLWPLSYVSRLLFPYQHGLYLYRQSKLFVSSGVGTWGPPMRLAALPEIVLITLRR